jgi:outer membrane protein OmpA-like peptidoglycan-associated protein
MNKRYPLVATMPYILGSIGLFSNYALYAESVPTSLEEKVIIKEIPVIKEVPMICTPSANKTEPCVAQGALKFVGGQTRLSIGLDTNLKSRAGVTHVFSETDNHASSAEAWVGIDVSAKANQDEEHLTGAGIKFNHHWISKNKYGDATHVNKVFVAVDQNKQRSRKASAGYGQETKNLFWSSYASKGFTQKFWAAHDEDDADIYDVTYEYGVGAKVGKMFESQLVRVRGGVDYEWGIEHSDYEDQAQQVSASITAEKFFQNSPHSVSANAAYFRKTGGDMSDKQSGVRGNINYRYDIGANVFRSDEKYRRVRVEIPATARAATYKQELVKNTMALEADNFFKLDRAELTTKATQRLETVIARMRQSGHEGNIRITGNTCNLGSVKHNQQLSERRASAIKQFFIAKGFKADELISRGLGENHPKYANSQQTRHKNRRVDIEYITEQKHFRKVLVDAGLAGEAKITWRQERCPTPPIWVQQALHNPIQHKSRVDDYRSIENNAGKQEDQYDYDDKDHHDEKYL